MRDNMNDDNLLLSYIVVVVVCNTYIEEKLTIFKMFVIYIQEIILKLTR